MAERHACNRKNKRRRLTLALGFGACALMALPASAETRMSVVGETNPRRTCPSTECGAVGRFYEGESVVVYESVDGWSRVSRYYTAGCNDGRSAFVDSGPDACTVENGIEQGEFAEWIRSDFLTADERNNPG